MGILLTFLHLKTNLWKSILPFPEEKKGLIPAYLLLLKGKRLVILSTERVPWRQQHLDLPKSKSTLALFQMQATSLMPAATWHWIVHILTQLPNICCLFLYI